MIDKEKVLPKLTLGKEVAFNDILHMSNLLSSLVYIFLLWKVIMVKIMFESAKDLMYI